jgi:hypothetical protein
MLPAWFLGPKQSQGERLILPKVSPPPAKLRHATFSGPRKDGLLKSLRADEKTIAGDVLALGKDSWPGYCVRAAEETWAILTALGYDALVADFVQMRPLTLAAGGGRSMPCTSHATCFALPPGLSATSVLRELGESGGVSGEAGSRHGPLSARLAREAVAVDPCAWLYFEQFEPKGKVADNRLLDGRVFIGKASDLPADIDGVPSSMGGVSAWSLGQSSMSLDFFRVQSILDGVREPTAGVHWLRLGATDLLEASLGHEAFHEKATQEVACLRSLILTGRLPNEGDP